ncbi:hypothetical protein S7711_05807 [Stachybotrys chartarum IBT 7711]|uniref:Uncharacterized protein n=1 Tax=Stachybotrys chartarum (strain CBS 109288 / IBT 7711) TaxID=1280523 RepID=A0A084AM45_STACB|nr:hypothetical protein S7711_05807 [Stachybotrys chartarum IBT 7711]
MLEAEAVTDQADILMANALLFKDLAHVRSTPAILFVSNDKIARKDPLKVIKESEILSEYPGFELGHCTLIAEYSDLRHLGNRESIQMFNDTKARGLVIVHNGFMMSLEANRPLRDNIDYLEAFSTSADDDCDCEITGLEDFDEDEVDEAEFIDVTSRGSLSPRQTQEIDSSDTSDNEVVETERKQARKSEFTDILRQPLVPKTPDIITSPPPSTTPRSSHGVIHRSDIFDYCLQAVDAHSKPQS